MKIKHFLIIAIVLLIQSCEQNSTKAQITGASIAVDNYEAQAKQMLKEFYTQYITEWDKMPSNLKTIEALEKKYLTKELQKKLKASDLDYDPFLNAQDCSKAWLKTLLIKPIAETENTYKVCYSYDSEHTNCITLFLVYSNGEFKINDIKDL